MRQSVIVELKVLMLQCASLLRFEIWTKDFSKLVLFLELYLKEWYYGSIVAQRVCIQAAANHKDEHFLHLASVCVAASRTSADSEAQVTDQFFSCCLRLSTYYGSWQLRIKLFTVERNLPQACSCVNGGKLTGTLTANTAELLQDVARKKKRKKKGAHLFLSSLISRDSNVWVRCISLKCSC